MGILKSSVKGICSGILIAGVSVNVIAALCYVSGVRVNTTKSIPVGLYRTTDEEIDRGSYVFFCPPDEGGFFTARERGYIAGGFCPGNYSYMMKKVMAMEGDLVSIDDEGMSVNTTLIAYSKLLDSDPAGRILPKYFHGQYTLKKSELLLMSDVSSTSFDGRYFGPVDSSQVKSVITPIVTWE